jgi:hypothetical protein
MRIYSFCFIAAVTFLAAGGAHAGTARPSISDELTDMFVVLKAFFIH